MRYGVNSDWSIGNDIVGPRAYQLCHDAGLTICRYALYWPNVNPQPGVWDFSVADAEINDALAAGMEVYINIVWAPSWANDLNAPTYLPFTAGCSTSHIAPDGSIAVAFDTSKSYCTDPPSIRAAAIWGICRKVIERYGDRVKYFGFWNEPNYDFFWPPRRLDTENNFKRYFDEIAKPSSDALRYYADHFKHEIQVVGPEVDDPGALRTLLELEMEAEVTDWRQHSGGGRLWDVISFHGYSWTDAGNGKKDFPDGSIGRIEEEFLLGVVGYQGGRPVWVSEIAGNPYPPTVEGYESQRVEIESFVKRVDWTETEVDAILLYRIKRGPTDHADHGLVTFDNQPTPALKAIKELLNPAVPAPRRRPARRPPGGGIPPGPTPTAPQPEPEPEKPKDAYFRVMTVDEFTPIRGTLKTGDKVYSSSQSGQKLFFVTPRGIGGSVPEGFDLLWVI